MNSFLEKASSAHFSDFQQQLRNLNPIGWWQKNEWLKFLSVTLIGGVMVPAGLMTVFPVEPTSAAFCPSQKDMKDLFKREMGFTNDAAALRRGIPVDVVIRRTADEKYANQRINNVLKQNYPGTNVELVIDFDFTQDKSGSVYFDKQSKRCRAQVLYN